MHSLQRLKLGKKKQQPPKTHQLVQYQLSNMFHMEHRVGKKCYSCWTVISTAANTETSTGLHQRAGYFQKSLTASILSCMRLSTDCCHPPHPHLRLKNRKHFEFSKSRETAWPSLWLTQLCAKFTFLHTLLSIT